MITFKQFLEGSDTDDISNLIISRDIDRAIDRAKLSNEYVIFSYDLESNYSWFMNKPDEEIARLIYDTRKAIVGPKNVVLLISPEGEIIESSNMSYFGRKPG